MDLLDGLILIVLAAAVIRGIDSGFVRQLFSTVGFFAGLFLGAWVESKIIHITHTTNSRTAISLIIILGFAVLFLIISELLADKLKHRIELTIIDKVDRILGAAVAGFAIITAVWLGASVFSNTPFPRLQQQIRNSAIVSRLNSTMPAAPEVIAKVGHLITPNGFPQVFTGSEPTPSTTDVAIPDMGELTPAVTAARASVVKVEGEGCGGIVEGSGFVADEGIVITNAHVIAGVAAPMVIDRNGTHRTTVIAFNPDLDLAVLRSLDLAGKPLTLTAKTVATGTPGAVLGYPGGGEFRADPAAIIDSFEATGRNIYNKNSVTREIYSMNADVISGNSGGPLINKNGEVIGVVFAHSVSYQHVGYSLTMPQVISQLQQAKQNIEPVGTGTCAE